MNQNITFAGRKLFDIAKRRKLAYISRRLA
jgi:hypothetical protein